MTDNLDSKNKDLPALILVSGQFLHDGEWFHFNNEAHKQATIAAGYIVRDLYALNPDFESRPTISDANDINPDDISAGMVLGYADAMILRGMVLELNHHRAIERGSQEIARAIFNGAVEEVQRLVSKERDLSWTGNEDADTALILLGRIETADAGDDDRIEQVQRIIRKLAKNAE